MKHFNKGYCYPSQETLLKRMKSNTGVDISRRTLNRWLRVIENHGLIVRTRRLKHDARMGMLFKSTLYVITFLGVHRLKKMGVFLYKVFKGPEKRTDNDIKPNNHESNMNGGNRLPKGGMTRLKYLLPQL